MKISEYSELSKQISNIGIAQAKEIENLKENHLHEVRDAINLLRNDMLRMLTEQNQVHNQMLSELIWIKSRLNGRDKN